MSEELKCPCGGEYNLEFFVERLCKYIHPLYGDSITIDMGRVDMLNDEDRNLPLPPSGFVCIVRVVCVKCRDEIWSNFYEGFSLNDVNPNNIFAYVRKNVKAALNL